MSEGRLSSQLANIEKEILELQKNIKGLNKTLETFDNKLNPEIYYLKNLKETFGEITDYNENSIRGNTENGNYETFAVGTQGYHICPLKEQNLRFPHKFHTSDGQLNNITDILYEIYKCTCGLDEKHKEIIDNFEKSQERQKDCDKCHILDKIINELLKQKEKCTNIEDKHRCITLEDLNKLIEKLQKTPEKGKEKRDFHAPLLIRER